MMMRLHWWICMGFMMTRAKSSGQPIHWKLRYLKIGWLPPPRLRCSILRMLQHHLGDTELSMMMRLHWWICMGFMTTRTKSSGQPIHWKLRYLKIGWLPPPRLRCSILRMLQHHLGDTELSMMMRLHWWICMGFMTTRTTRSGQPIHWKLRYLKIGWLLSRGAWCQAPDTCTTRQLGRRVQFAYIYMWRSSGAFAANREDGSVVTWGRDKLWRW